MLNLWGNHWCWHLKKKIVWYIPTVFTEYQMYASKYQINAPKYQIPERHFWEEAFLQCTLGTLSPLFLPRSPSPPWDKEDMIMKYVIVIERKTWLGTLSKKKKILFGNFSQHRGGAFPNPKTFVNLSSIFFVCQIHSEVLKHVLQMGG